MITIPTGDLTGILSDAVPFASPEKDLPDSHCVRIFWDGNTLHTQAHDEIHMGWSRWTADEDHVQDSKDFPANGWGGADDPWSVTIRLDDAKHLIKTYQLGAKQYFVPLTVEPTGHGLRIQRTRDSGRSAISTVVRDTAATFVDLQRFLAEHDTIEAVQHVNVDAKRLAAFSKVRPRGAMLTRFTGEGKPLIVTIGDQFTGAIKQFGQYRKPDGTESILRDGAGVYLSGAAS